MLVLVFWGIQRRLLAKVHIHSSCIRPDAQRLNLAPPLISINADDIRIRDIAALVAALAMGQKIQVIQAAVSRLMVTDENLHVVLP